MPPWVLGLVQMIETHCTMSPAVFDSDDKACGERKSSQQTTFCRGFTTSGLLPLDRRRLSAPAKGFVLGFYGLGPLPCLPDTRQKLTRLKSWVGCEQQPNININMRYLGPGVDV